MFPFLLNAVSIIGGAIVGWKIVRTADNTRRDATPVGHKLANAADDYMGHPVENANLITYVSVWLFMTLTNRLNIIMCILAATAFGFVAMRTPSFLSYLTDFSSYLRAIFWFLFTALCFFMVRNYNQHSRSCENMIKDSAANRKRSSGKDDDDAPRRKRCIPKLDNYDRCFIHNQFTLID
ncbi:unnamed protein product [Adineta steineri]|uniref:Uncharacterized protein n=1 Tax=Adineta steineri TaxID=433720 RepID=A0A814MGA0_9BILA|nr:unnamed protein product [Adineta steineri]CAF1079114.1 unnamed protein product [Adineta steineri]